MSKSLGIYIEDNSIKYSKVDKSKDALKIDAFGTVFYDSDNLNETIDRIVQETFSAKDPICINISNEIYNYFEVFSALKSNDQKKSIDLDFELLCGEKGYNKDSLDCRYTIQPSKNDSDKLRVIHIGTNKENLAKRVKEFGQYKVSSATPITTSIKNLTELAPKENNVIIVNIEDDTKITTILNDAIYDINVIPEGMGEILSKINSTENSMQKSYECAKNITIYTQDVQEMQIVEDNEHIDDVMPVLYKIVSEVKTIADSSSTPINKILLTGTGTAINNIDLYFQEYIPNIKCELLKPFFMESASIKTPIKEYIEVNSATSLALEQLGYGMNELNFRGKGDSGGGKVSISLDSNEPLTALDKTLLRITACVCIAIIAYAGFSSFITNKINDRTAEAENASTVVQSQIADIQSDIAEVSSGTSEYNSLIQALTTTDDDSESITGTIIKKDAIPNLLNRIVYIIPEQVKITSIKNTTGSHIVIEAQASKYEQLGYFKAAITNNAVLTNVKSSSGSNSGGVVTVTIEGDLP